MRSTNQAVAKLGEEAHVVAVPKASTFKTRQTICPSNVGILKALDPSCDVMRVVGQGWGVIVETG